MQLATHSDTSYPSVSQARSRASGVNFLTEGPPNPENPTNRILLAVCKIMHNIMASAAEAEYGTIFINAQTAVPIRTTLSETGWTQGPTAIQVENSTAVGIVTKEFHPNKSNAMDMRLYWINERIK